MNTNANRPSHFVADYMLHNGYNISPVNPRHKIFLDIKCYSALKGVPQKVDIVIIISDPNNGPVITTLNQDSSKTNLVNISLGIGF